MPARQARRVRSLDQLRADFPPVPGHLDAATAGVPTRGTSAALREDLDRWVAGGLDAARYDDAVHRARLAFARLVGVAGDRVAVGSQTSVLAALVAASVPDGAEVLCVDGDFSSMVFPFLVQQPRIRVRHVPAERLADAIGPRTELVAFSLVQSATGTVLDGPAVAEVARGHGARTFCDLTQAAGWKAVDADRYDLTATAAYKWLCAPRGTAFLTVAEHAQPGLVPAQAGWYAGQDVWGSCYGPAMRLADDARRFDVSPAWQAWIGAAESVDAFASVDPHEVEAWSAGLADALRTSLDLPPTGSAVVTLHDPDGGRRTALEAAGCRVAGRAGRVRLAFHVWDDERDVARALEALTTVPLVGAA
jgi:selenocysteine lyase/cysteine desulfurase